MEKRGSSSCLYADCGHSHLHLNFYLKKKSGCPQLLSFILNKPYLFCHWQKGRSFKRTILYITFERWVDRW